MLLDYYPNKFPDFKLTAYKTPFHEKLSSVFVQRVEAFSEKKEREQLDEVVIIASLEKQRIEKIKRKSYGKMEFFTNKKTPPVYTLELYLSKYNLDLVKKDILIILDGVTVLDNESVFRS